EAVSKLKSRLPEVLKAASKSPEEPEPYTLWGIALDKDFSDEKLNVLLVKFLRARDLNLDLASKMLSDSIAWRKEFKADSILDEEFDESVFGGVGYIHKTDKEGRPVCYNFYGELDQEAVFGDLQKFIRWRVQLMEKGVKLVDFVNVDTMVQIHDYKGVSMFGRTANSKQATKEIIKIMQDNYPKFLSTKFFVNIPWWGSKIFKLIRPLLPEATVMLVNARYSGMTLYIDFNANGLLLPYPAAIYYAPVPIGNREHYILTLLHSVTDTHHYQFL
ncbi:CRAL-TRIO domain-containing protein, partial [Zychaea mexicana]|uniref:CRAL-TRIO domain-containing protein n=1 Tax=Zychaea mexicana TaxID=64656 RepID=UPI0022FE1B8E